MTFWNVIAFVTDLARSDSRINSNLFAIINSHKASTIQKIKACKTFCAGKSVIAEDLAVWNIFDTTEIAIKKESFSASLTNSSIVIRDTIRVTSYTSSIDRDTSVLADLATWPSILRASRNLADLSLVIQNEGLSARKTSLPVIFVATSYLTIVLWTNLKRIFTSTSSLIVIIASSNNRFTDSLEKIESRSTSSTSKYSTIWVFKTINVSYKALFVHKLISILTARASITNLGNTVIDRADAIFQNKWRNANSAAILVIGLAAEYLTVSIYS